MEKDCRFGPMGHFMKVTGETTRQTGEEDLYMLMETSMKENGRTIRLMVSGNITTLMELCMKVTGVKTNSMDMAKKHGLTVHATKVSTRMERKTDMASLTGQMAPHIRVSL